MSSRKHLRGSVISGLWPLGRRLSRDFNLGRREGAETPVPLDAPRHGVVAIRAALFIAAGCLGLAACMTRPLAEAPCQGAADLSVPSSRLIVLGEIHGTAEAPRLLGDIACKIALEQKERLTVFLELEHSTDARLQEFLNSSGSKAERCHFLKHRPWTNTQQDGRTSAAMLALIEHLRALRSQGSDLTVHAFAGSGDREYAKNLRRMLALEHDRRAIVLVGNVHASKTPWNPGPGRNGETMTSLLADLSPLTLNLSSLGGYAWIKTPEEPRGPQELESDAARGITTEQLRYGIISLQPEKAGDFSWDGRFAIGKATASAPAVGECRTPGKEAHD